MGIYGQDWASYQSAQPDTSGLSFAFTKISEGTGYINPLWARQRDHAKANGLVWGGYHYPHMGSSPQAEADFFLGQVAWQPGDVIILDWEGYDPANAGVSRASQLAYKDAWLRYVKGRMPHNPVGAYMNADYWNNVDTTGYYADFLWIATAGLPAGQPGIHASWLFHQYSDSPVDSDYCPLGSTAELRTWALSFAQPTPTPAPEPDMPLTPDDVAAIWNHVEPDPLTGGQARMGTVLAWRDQDQINQTATLTRQIAASTAAITALAAQIGAQHSTVDTAAVVAAVQAAIAAAVVHVDVNVSGPTPAA